MKKAKPQFSITARQFDYILLFDLDRIWARPNNILLIALPYETIEYCETSDNSFHPFLASGWLVCWLGSSIQLPIGVFQARF